MKYRDLNIQTQREAPNNARTPGFSFLVRAGYLTRENTPTPLGQYTLDHLHRLASDPGFTLSQYVPILAGENELFFPLPSGSIQVAHCSQCGYTERLELARFEKRPGSAEPPKPLEKVSTPDCHTIEALANFLRIPKEKTAKALMYTRAADGKFIFVVVRGDRQLSEAKLAKHAGVLRPASAEEIHIAGAAAGYASPIGLKEALIAVDDLIPQSSNLVAGANESGYHFRNTNFERDYSAEIVADLVQAQEGDPCTNCRHPLALTTAILLAAQQEVKEQNVLLALAQTHHDEKGLSLPAPAAPFDLYLMHIPGRELDTAATAAEIYASLQNAGISVLFDDREERAGVKFNDADLIGSPLRVTVGEKALKGGMVELKPRREKEIQLIAIDAVPGILQSLLK